ncbi:MAG TPA: RNA polymerase sigma factor [Vicinamibacteria bacterium]
MVLEDDEPARASTAGYTDEAVTELRARMQRAVRRVCPSWLVDRQDDLVQMATMRVLEARRSAEGNPEVAASYLYRVAYTTLIDEIRRLRRRPEVPLEDAAGESLPVSATTPGPDQDYAARQIGRAIRECLLLLLQPRRLAVTLHLQGHTVPEAAALLGWTTKRTENLVYRGLSDLRSCLQGKGVSP